MVHAFSYAYIELCLHLGSLESTQEARVALNYPLSNSHASRFPNFPLASITRYTHAKHEPIFNFRIEKHCLVRQFAFLYSLHLFVVRTADWPTTNLNSWNVLLFSRNLIGQLSLSGPGYSRRTAIGSLQLINQVVQIRHTGEQETQWDKTNKEHTSFKMVISFV